MKNIKTIFITLKTGIKNPKTRSLTLLGIYILFFIFVVIVFNQSKSVTKNVKVEKKEEIENEISSYEYSYNFSIKDSVDIILGTHNDKEDLFVINEVKYYKNKEEITNITNPNDIVTLKYDIDNYSYNNMDKLISSLTPLEKTTYLDNSSKEIYEIDILDLNKYLNVNEECLYKTCASEKIQIIVNKDKYIKSIKIDFSKYYRYDFIIELNYSSINNISKIEINTLTE